ncbi:MAG: HRDC domain-containing protein [Gammaproteobacteria bacterium]
MIETASELDSLCGTLEKAELVALDTEFVRESTYFAELCLIQLAIDKRIVCIDCCANLELGRLFECLFSPAVRLVAHSGRQDIELLQQAAGQLPALLIDTQIAAGLLGHAPQIGLQEILLARLGVEIEKTMARTDWRRRPISHSALSYAATDVEYLLPLWRSLAEELNEKNRTAWFEEDCARALSVELEPSLVLLYQRTRGTGRLRGRQIGAALALLAWREARARAANRPRRWILRDDVLVEIARSAPTNAGELNAIQGISPKTAGRYGEHLLDALAKAETKRFMRLADECMPAPRPDAHELKALQSRVRGIANELGIEPEIIATRRDLVATVLGSPPPHIAGGWRSKVLAAAA